MKHIKLNKFYRQDILLFLHTALVSDAQIAGKQNSCVPPMNRITSLPLACVNPFC